MIYRSTLAYGFLYNRLPRIAVLLALSLIPLNACGPLVDGAALLDEDIYPPVFYDALSASPTSVQIRLSEQGHLEEASLSVAPALSLKEVEDGKETITLHFEEEMEPGRSYALSARIADTAGNTLTFITELYGFNPRVPELLLNEITTQGSSSNPDKVELLVLTAGNTAGVTLFEGTRDYWTHKKILPPVEVRPGDYIVVHCKPEGRPDEVDETEDPFSCNAEEAVDGAWDFWIAGGSGLSGNNGVISIYSSARGTPIDGFLYSNRTSSSDERYRGFGSNRALERADQLAAQEEWQIAGRAAAPEDAVNPEDSTATRSMCRSPGAEDTDTAADWHIVPTRGSSFGTVNTTEVYQP